MKNRYDTFNDGVCYFYEVKSNNVTDFNAKKNERTLDDMKKICYMAFEERSQRAEDVEFAETVGRSLNLKIRVRFNNMINKTNKVVIGNMLYDIFKLDIDKRNRTIFIYLEEVRELC